MSSVFGQMLDLVLDVFDESHWPVLCSNASASIFLVYKFGQFLTNGPLTAESSSNGGRLCPHFCRKSSTYNSVSVEYCLRDYDVTELADDFLRVLGKWPRIASAILVVDWLYIDVQSHDVSCIVICESESTVL